VAFGPKAILPPEIVYPTLRVKLDEEEVSDKQLHKNLDLLEKKWAEAHLKMLDYKKVVARLYNHKVHSRHVGSGDLIWRKVEVSDLSRSRGKLAPNMEDPYRVIKAV
ncbi:hypothetical protein BHM03_00056884, partial [Ensete ventricosum]